MKEWQTILLEGISALRSGDKDIDRLLSPRCDEVISSLERYIGEIMFFNPAYGLVGTNDQSELVIKHILDSLAPVGILWRLLSEVKIEDRPQIADAGSGAGLPGIPLAIAFPNYHFTLIERMGRRSGFLLNTKAVVGLSNVTVEESELEKKRFCNFALVTFRAFKPLEPKLLTTLFNCCTQGGVIAAYKGKREKIEQEMMPLKEHCGEWEAIPCRVPYLDEERHIVVIKRPHIIPDK